MNEIINIDELTICHASCEPVRGDCAKDCDHMIEQIAEWTSELEDG